MAHIHQIAAETGIDADDLRSFANGITIPDGFALDTLAKHLKLKLRPVGVGHLLPLEDDASLAIQERFANELYDAASVLKLGLKVIGSTPTGPGQLPDITKPRGLNWHVVDLCLGLYSKILKHLRAVIALCELGLADDAKIATRAMFEGTLALHFILKPRSPLMENGRKIEKIRKVPESTCPNCRHILRPEVPELPLKQLGTHMRAKLYVAHTYIEREREFDAYQRHKMPMPPEIFATEDTIRKAAASARKAIGPGWTQRLKHKGYSGISVRDLADSYKLLPYYLTIYREQSAAVHGMNASNYYEFNEADGLKLNLGPSPEGIDTELFIATTLTAGAMQLLDKRLGLGFDTEINAVMADLAAKGKAL